MAKKYGVTPQGFVRPSLQDILRDIQSDQRASIGHLIDQSPESILGQLNAIFARQLSMAWESLETAYNGFDPDRAEDFLLTALAKLTGTRREGESKSQVIAGLGILSGTTLEAGVHFAHLTGKPDVRFTPVETFTAPDDGFWSVPFEAEVPGPIAVEAFTLTAIATPVNGWQTVNNLDPGTPGRLPETDPELRAKREQDLASAGNQTGPAIKADLLALGPWVRSVEYYDNDTDDTDGEGRPPHSFEVLIYDANGPGEADDLIAQAIWQNKPAGIRPWGDDSEQGTAIDETGAEVTIEFSRVTEVPIHIELSLTTVPGFSDVAAVEDRIVEYATAEYQQPGTDVVALFIRSIALGVEGVLDVPSFDIGTSSNPSGDANISLGIREVATFDQTNITIA